MRETSGVAPGMGATAESTTPRARMALERSRAPMELETAATPEEQVCGRSPEERFLNIELPPYPAPSVVNEKGWHMTDEILERTLSWAHHVRETDARFQDEAVGEIIRRRPEIHQELDHVDRMMLGKLANKVAMGFGLPRSYPDGLTAQERE